MRSIALVLFVAALAVAGEITEREFEEGQPNPNVIRPGDTFVGRFSDAKDEDKIVVECDRVTICTLVIDVPVRKSVTFGGDEVIPRRGYTHRKGDPLRFRRYRFPAGRTVLTLSGGEAFDYRLTVTAVSVEPRDEVEPNDDEGHTVELALGEPVNGVCSRPQNDVDFYAIEVPRRAIHRVSVKRAPTTTTGWIRISDGRSWIHDYRYDARFEELAYYPVLDPGRYVLSLYVTGAPGAGYTLQVEPFEPTVTEEHVKEARAAIDRGVAWLEKTTPTQNERAANYQVAVTALELATLCEQGGYAKRRDLVEKEYVDYLAARFREDEKGEWRGEKVSSPSTKIYEAAVATLGLAEAAEAGSEKAAALAARGARYLLASQQTREKVAAWNGPVDPKSKTHGGWRYTADAADSDLSVTGWCWVALSAVDAAGLDVPGLRTALDAGLGYARECGQKDGFHYTPSGHTSVTLTSIGMLVYLLHGEEDWRLTAAFRALDPHLPAGTQVRRGNGYCFYHWYYGTRANYLRGGYPWQAWRAVMIRQLLLQQEEDGRWKAIDYERSAGDRFTTALGVMILRICLEQVPGYLKHEVRGF